MEPTTIIVRFPLKRLSTGSYWSHRSEKIIGENFGSMIKPKVRKIETGD